MKILSDFQDYYDSALGVAGVDTEVVFRRFTKRLEPNTDAIQGWFETLSGGGRTPFWEWRNYSPLWHYRPEAHPFAVVQEFIIFFCGKIHYGIEVSPSGLSTPNPARNLIFFDDAIGGFIENYLNIALEEYAHSVRYFGEQPYNAFLEIRLRMARLESSSVIQSLHVAYNAPILVHVFPDTLLINPSLKQYHFMRLYDTYTAFQELAMFVGGVLAGNENPLLEVSERDKLLQHGFDDKWSFRNPDPPKRKQKRKK